MVLLVQVVPLLVLSLVLLTRPTAAAQAGVTAPVARTGPVAVATGRRILHPELRPQALDAAGRTAALLGSAPEPDGSTAYSVDLGVAGTRSYVLHLPAVLPAGPRPLVLVLPGLHTSATSVEQASGFDAVGDVTGAVVVYPQGIKESWDAGACCNYAAAAGVDDVTALRSIVDAVETQVAIDRRKVVIGGFSNGGMMAYRMACEQARGIAGIIVVSGALEVSDCAPAAPVALVVSHGLRDETVPDAGETTPNHTVGAPTRSVAESVAPFAAVDACNGMAREKRLAPYTAQYYRGCGAGTQITVLTVDTLAHAWPGPTLGGRSFSATAYALLADRRSQTEFR